jgi:OmpA-OmpF porin, OOP family
MKINKLLLVSIFSLILNLSLHAQYLEKLARKTQQKIENEAEKRTEKRINKGIDNVFDKAEEDIDSTTKEEKKKTAKKKNSSAPENNVEDTKTITNSTLTWNQYDFIPGTEIIFEDNQEGEQNGEFPSKWDLVRGNIENANFDGDNVIYFISVNANGGGGIVPLIKNNTEDYLPEEFTVEFDAYFPDQHLTYYLFFADYKNQKKISRSGSNQALWAAEKYLRFTQNGADGKNIASKTMPDTKSNTNIPRWRHISVSFNKRALKAYIDDTRILNIPNIEFNPTGIGLSSHNSDGKRVGYIKNIRIAKGAVPLYDKLLTDGKFVTTGIKFDVNKATIKPESMGTINYVVKMMQDHPELKFSVEGHTDSDGDDASNQKLSEARAKAVVEEMVKLGISKNRLTSNGFGESKPITTNNTSEGKAQNRRVEFVKKQ